jgi:hypothetical protein
MSEELVDEPFNSAAERVEQAYGQAKEELKSKVAKSKSAALKKITQ